MQYKIKIIHFFYNEKNEQCEKTWEAMRLFLPATGFDPVSSWL